MTEPTAQQRLQAAYDKVKHFPENSHTGWIDLIELRQCAAAALLQMETQTREIARLHAHIADLEDQFECRNERGET